MKAPRVNDWYDTPRPAALLEKHRQDVREVQKLAQALADEVARERRAKWAARAVVVILLAAAAVFGAAALKTELGTSVDAGIAARLKERERASTAADLPPLTPRLQTLTEANK